MTPHAELGASAAERWMNCSGSIALSRGQPESASDYAREGTAAHALAEKALGLDADPAIWRGEQLKGFEVDDEMVESVQLFVETVKRQTTPDATVMLEHKFSLAALKPPAAMYGTADVVLYTPTTRHLYVYDLKYGRGVVVDPTENPQLMYYGLGALLAFEKAHGYGKVDAVTLTIVQPRAPHPDGPVRSIEVTTDALTEFAVELLGRADAALAPGAARTPGPWCRFCQARPVCPEAAGAALAVAQMEFADAGPPDPETLPVPLLSEILDKQELLEGWLRAVRERAQHLLERGEHVPGWKLVAKRATRKWVDEAAVATWCEMAGLTPEQYQEDPKLRSPAQMEKVLKPIKVALPEDLYDSVSSGNTLAPQHDKRPALACSAADDFAALPAGSPRNSEETTQ